ncbi:splicing factor PWI domain-containing protein isoform X1 [Iris pallida]|uniref:Splicing factor PWI domain-containing protein isoform X1 n=1 Tax=Iris pallida TaxID=29817 RepID=A0AAX6I007_IRIPA|nr:splicing factor PWI domain-containing protein isoform X1 [Iris pallida]
MALAEEGQCHRGPERSFAGGRRPAGGHARGDRGRRSESTQSARKHSSGRRTRMWSTPELRALGGGEGRLFRATRGGARPNAGVAGPGAGRGGVARRDGHSLASQFLAADGDSQSRRWPCERRSLEARRRW